jgi:hypothetical protein
LGGFVQALSAAWRIALLRFALALIALVGAWWYLAPPYAHLLTWMARPLLPVTEQRAETTYWVEGATVYTIVSFLDPGTQQRLNFKAEIWKGYASYDLILLMALIVATPGWSLRQRGRLLGLGLILITGTEFAFFLSTMEYVQLRTVTSGSGAVLLPPGFSRPRQIVATWVYYFFQTMGRGLFPLLIYWGMVGFTWRPASHRAPAGKTSAPDSSTPPGMAR